MTGFKKATRQHIYLKLALTGPSGSGKTYSALQLAFGLGKRIALIDTENASASLYCELGDFDTLELTPPFTAKKYIEAIQLAVRQGYDVVIIDSLSHAWAGDGGLLAQKESMDSRGGNSFANWAVITKQHEQMKSAVLQAPIHVIATMRSKQDYILTERDGKQVPQKVGLAPIQRDDIQYEFTTVLDIGMNHEAISSKDRTGLFDSCATKLTPEHGAMLRKWLAGQATESPGLQSNEREQSNGQSVVRIDIVNIADRDVDGQSYSFIVGAEQVIQLPVLDANQREDLMREKSCMVNKLVDTKRSVKVGGEQLPVYTGELVNSIELVTSVSGKREVSRNGQG